MQITSIRIRKNKNNNGNVLGTASIQLDDCLVIHGIQIINLDGKRGLSFPNRRTKKYIMENGEYVIKNTYADIVHPSNVEFRKYLETEIFKIYDKDEKGDNN